MQRLVEDGIRSQPLSLRCIVAFEGLGCRSVRCRRVCWGGGPEDKNRQTLPVEHQAQQPLETSRPSTLGKALRLYAIHRTLNLVMGPGAS